LKDRLIEKVLKENDPLRKINLAREYLQELIMYVLFYNRWLGKVILDGSSCLRFSYGLSRFTEGLHFSSNSGVDGKKLALLLGRELGIAGYKTRSIVEEKNGEINVILRFYNLEGIIGKGLLNISLRIERAKKYRSVHSTLWKGEFPIRFFYHDVSYVLAKKISAVITGNSSNKDYYDLFWLLRRKKGVEPQVEIILNSAEKMNPKLAEEIIKKGWKAVFSESLEKISQDKLLKELLPFVEQPEELFLLDRQALVSLVSG